MDTTKKFTVKKRFFLIGIAVLLLIALVAVWYWNTHKKTFVKEKVSDRIYKKSNGIYTIQYANLAMDELKGNLAFSNISIEYDSLKVDSLMAQKAAPSIIFRIHADSLLARGIKTPKALLTKELVGNNLRLVHPTIEMIYINNQRDSVRREPSKELYQQILGNLKLIGIDSLSIQNAQLITREILSPKKNLCISNISIVMNDLLIDSVSTNDTSRLFFAKQSHITCDEISWHSKSEHYSYAAKQLQMNTQTKELKIDTFFVTPQFTEKEVTKIFKVRHDRYDFNLYNIGIGGLNFYQLFSNRTLMAEKIAFNNSSFKIYRDMTMPQDNSSMVGRYPQQALMKMGLPLYVPSIELSNCFVEYKEKNNDTKEDGNIRFYNVNASLNNVTNIEQKVRQDNRLVANVKSDFLERIPFTLNWVMYLSHPEGKFSIKGVIGAFDGTIINKVTEPMGPVRIESGNIKKIKFDFTGSDHKMDGSLFMLYDNLKVSVLEKKDGKLEKKGFQSLLANTIINNANPQGNGEVRITPIHNERDKTWSIFSHIWKSIFTGVKGNIGLKK